MHRPHDPDRAPRTRHAQNPSRRCDRSRRARLRGPRGRARRLTSSKLAGERHAPADPVCRLQAGANGHGLTLLLRGMAFPITSTEEIQSPAFTQAAADCGQRLPNEIKYRSTPAVPPG